MVNMYESFCTREKQAFPETKTTKHMHVPRRRTCFAEGWDLLLGRASSSVCRASTIIASFSACERGTVVFTEQSERLSDQYRSCRLLDASRTSTRPRRTASFAVAGRIQTTHLPPASLFDAGRSRWERLAHTRHERARNGRRAVHNRLADPVLLEGFQQRKTPHSILPSSRDQHDCCMKKETRFRPCPTLLQATTTLHIPALCFF